MSPHEAYDAVRGAFVAHARGEWSMPSKVYVTNYPAGDFRAMPAIGGGHALLKWVTSFPGNPARGLPTVTGLVLLSDAEDGALLAVLDAAAVTALRTAAAGVLAADTLCRAEASSYAVIGCGVNGAETARMLVAHGVTPLVWDVDEGRRASSPSGSARVRAASAAEALACEVVVTVTPGARCSIREGSLEAGQHVSLMGADGPGKAEVAVEELARAHLFCDDWEQASHGGELARGRRRPASCRRDDVTELGAVLTGRRTAAAARATSRSSTRQASRSRISRSRRRPTRRPASSTCSSSSSSGRGAAQGSNRSSSGSRSPRIARATSRAAREAEHVAVARVAAGHPEPVVARDAPDHGQEVEDHPEDARPAVVDAERTADVLLDEPLERTLDDGRRDLVGRELGVERDVPEAARDDAAVEPLVPVVEAVPAVVRDLEQQLRDRLGRDHLAARRDDQALELAEQAARVAVGRDDDRLGVGLLEGADARVLVDLDPASPRAPRSRRTSRAGCSTPSGGWKSAAG